MTIIVMMLACLNTKALAPANTPLTDRSDTNNPSSALGSVEPPPLHSVVPRA